MDIKIACMSWLLWRLMQWTLGCMYLFKLEFSPDMCPRVGSLNHMVVPVLVFWGTSVFFSIVAVPVYIPTISVGGFSFYHNLSSIYCLYNRFLMMTILISVKVKVFQSFLTLCNPMDCNPPDSSVHGILQARLLEWVAMPSSRGSSEPRNQTQVSLIAGGFFTVWATREALLTSVRWYVICSFGQIISDIEYLFMCFLAIWVISLEKGVF